MLSELLMNPSIKEQGLSCLLTRDCDKHWCGILPVLILRVDPELPAMPPLGVLDLERGERVRRLNLEVGTRRGDRLVFEKPDHLEDMQEVVCECHEVLEFYPWWKGKDRG